MQDIQIKRNDPETHVLATEWLQSVTGDYIVAKKEQDKGLHGETAALLLLDNGTSISDVFPVKKRAAELAEKQINHFRGKGEIKSFWADNAPEIKKACDTLKIPMDNSPPQRPKSNGVIENMVGICKGGARTNLFQAGLDTRWWALAARHAMFSRSTRIRQGTSPWNIDGRKTISEGPRSHLGH